MGLDSWGCKWGDVGWLVGGRGVVFGKLRELWVVYMYVHVCVHAVCFT